MPIQITLAERWKELLECTDLAPIDVHTPMWLWSRGRFEIDIERYYDEDIIWNNK